MRLKRHLSYILTYFKGGMCTIPHTRLNNLLLIIRVFESTNRDSNALFNSQIDK